ncbi:MAG: hypothetical protein V8T45_00550 [Oscillospiraceae bacterium]
MAGDCREKTVRQLTTAAADGSAAALAACAWLGQIGKEQISMKRFIVDKAVFEKLPDYCVGVGWRPWALITGSTMRLWKLLDEAAAAFAAANKETNIRELPGVKACRRPS